MRMVWDETKVLIRDYVIQCNSEFKKKRQKKMQTILDEIIIREIRNFPENTSVSQQIRNLQQQLSMLIIKEM